MTGAESLLRKALVEAERSGRPRAIAKAAQSLYYLLRRQGRHVESVAALERKVDALRRLEGTDGPWTTEWRNELIALYGAVGRPDDLEAVCRERLESDVRRHGERSPEAVWALVTLAWALRESGRWDEAEARSREALALIEAIAGPDDPRTGWALAGLAVVRERRCDPAGAEAALCRARANWSRVGHADRVAAVDELLIDLYVGQQRHCEALQLSLAWFSGRDCTTDERRLRRTERHAALLRAVGREEEAVTCEARARELGALIELRRRESDRLSADAPETPGATSCVAGCLTGPVFPSPLL